GGAPGGSARRGPAGPGARTSPAGGRGRPAGDRPVPLPRATGASGATRARGVGVGESEAGDPGRGRGIWQYPRVRPVAGGRRARRASRRVAGHAAERPRARRGRPREPLEGGVRRGDRRMTAEALRRRILALVEEFY